MKYNLVIYQSYDRMTFPLYNIRIENLINIPHKFKLQIISITENYIIFIKHKLQTC